MYHRRWFFPGFCAVWLGLTLLTFSRAQVPLHAKDNKQTANFIHTESGIFVSLGDAPAKAEFLPDQFILKIRTSILQEKSRTQAQLSALGTPFNPLF
jgi:hypothetical protein